MSDDPRIKAIEFMTRMPEHEFNQIWSTTPGGIDIPVSATARGEELRGRTYVNRTIRNADEARAVRQDILRKNPDLTEEELDALLGDHDDEAPK